MGRKFLLVKVESTGEVSGVVGQDILGKDVKLLDLTVAFFDGESAGGFKKVVGEVVNLGGEG